MLIRLWDSRRQAGVGEPPGASAAARLVQVEVQHRQHAQELVSASRQLNKLQLRVHLMGRDLQTPLQQVQLENVRLAEATAKLADKVEKLHVDANDTQRLLNAMQSVSAKQFDLVMKALRIAQAQRLRLPAVHNAPDSVYAP
ncbi:hypothetical protein WJX72_001352 [[Myrmecia] bisecta]|uniref:Uncharacterized protein n=1 Tax=[Myrmecia] bisecta TaxID=41462 RepID=A0AAW1R4Z3_9CHLO